MTAAPPLTAFHALSFDIYGTLIDWEAGILRDLQPLIRQLPATHPCAVNASLAIAAFDRHERAIIQDEPKILYDDALRHAYLQLANEWGLNATHADAEAVVAGVATWECFPDTVAAMRRLGQRYKLIALSNVSRRLFHLTQTGPLRDVHFDATYLAEDIGSYKPARANFEYLLSHVHQDLGVDRAHLLHVGQGVAADQVPAEEMGITHAWIERGRNNWKDIVPHAGCRAYHTLGDLADDVDGKLSRP